MSAHPLEPIKPDEIKKTVDTLKRAGHFSSNTRICSIILHEPGKQFVFGWSPGQPFPRKAEVTLYDNTLNECSVIVVDLKGDSIQKQTIPGAQPLMTTDEAMEVIAVIAASEEFRKKVFEHYGDHPAVKFNHLICDPWSAGYYGDERDHGLRLARPICFFQDPRNGNPYAYPIEGLRPVVDLNKMTVIRVEDYGVFPFPPEHHASHRWELMESELRQDLRPLEISQPEGASFQVSGHYLSWQKWSMVIGFNGHEGLTLHDLRYDGRTILYRAAISEMVVPYGDPRAQHARKNAFDVGEYGMGHCTNSLKLGCDCLGTIRYFDGHMVTSRGDLWTIENAVCVHEEDDGVLWKHTDRSTNNTQTRRSRRLVVSTFATLGNYDYGFYWYFYQDGTIELEAKLTGFPSVGAWPDAATQPQHGNLMAPQVYAPNHQHYFNYRLDFAVDGIENSVYQIDVVEDEETDANPFKNAFQAVATPYERENDAKSHVSVETSRTWTIANEQKTNHVGKPVAYKLIPGENATPKASRDAWWRKRARFVDYHVWVTPFQPDELCCAGAFPYQSREDKGLPMWTSKNRKVRNQDCVLWYTFGVTHIPRPEDYPVMPTVKAGFQLKPFGFFDHNPAIDVPPQCQVNKKSQSLSVAESETHGNAEP